MSSRHNLAASRRRKEEGSRDASTRVLQQPPVPVLAQVPPVRPPGSTPSRPRHTPVTPYSEVLALRRRAATSLVGFHSEVRVSSVEAVPPSLQPVPVVRHPVPVQELGACPQSSAGCSSQAQVPGVREIRPRPRDLSGSWRHSGPPALRLEYSRRSFPCSSPLHLPGQRIPPPPGLLPSTRCAGPSSLVRLFVDVIINKYSLAFF